MEYLIYLVYPLLLVVFLWGCKLSRRGEWNEDAFSLRQMKALQGFAAVMIMLHHCSQKVSASWLDRQYYIPGLEFFVQIGFVLTSFFTFSSGYGLYRSFKSKPGYLENGFIRKRIVPVVILGYAVAYIFLIARLFMGEKIEGLQLIRYITGIQLSNPNGWYVIVISAFYLCFFLAFRNIKNEKAALTAVLTFTVAFQLLGASLDHYDFWMCGEWWFNSIHLFVVGIFFAIHEEKIVTHLKKHYVLYLIVSMAAILAFSMLSDYTKAVVSYYGEYSNLEHKVLRRLICLTAEILFSSAVVLCTLLAGMKIKIGNRFLDFMGKITLEFYLIHGLFIDLFCHVFNGKVPNSALFVRVVFVLSIPSAMLLKAVETRFKIKG